VVKHFPNSFQCDNTKSDSCNNAAFGSQVPNRWYRDLFIVISVNFRILPASQKWLIRKEEAVGHSGTMFYSFRRGGQPFMPQEEYGN
jgi:hypothetical protein